MLRLNEAQRGLLAEKACDSGNLAAGALIFGQFLGERFSGLLALGGAAVWLIFWAGAAVLLSHRKEKRR